MNERWQRLSRQLDELFDLDATARAAQLARIEADDAALAVELRRLLAADEHSGVLDAGVARAAPTVMAQLAAGEAAPATPAVAGKRVGHYRLLERIGSGGMGEVWRGARDDGEFEQQVAIKLIRPLLDSPHLRERFARERRILARLDHPNIARLLDGGVSEDGTPWYAMEYVRGVDLLRYAADKALDTRARVELLLQVCDAVAHAQTLLVVHRDLKPSNVLVDAEGRARVLDFGIARLLDETDAMNLTGTGVRVFSPAYAAPEQIRGEAVGTAADVFALGAVLYELLTGQVPHPQRSAVPERLLATLEQETAPRPSEALRATTASGARTTRGARELAGDLDTVVATSLQPEPARRYAGATQLGDDLRRWLDGRPIAARPDTATYRMRKFVARHRLAVGSASAVLLALVGGLGLALWQAGVAREHAARADAQALRANAEAARAEREAAQVKAQVGRTKKVKEFLMSVFQQTDPLRHRSVGPVTFDEAFDAAVQRAHTELADDAVLQADVFDDFGEIRTGQGRFDDAQALFEQALAVAEKEYGPDSPVVAESLVNLASIDNYRERIPAGAARMERAVAILEKDDGGDPLALANALTSLASMRQQQGRLQEAVVLARRAVEISRRHLGAYDIVLSANLTNLAMLEAATGQRRDAEAGLREAMRIVEKNQGVDSPRLLPILSQLGHVLYAHGKSGEEIDIYRRALAIARKSFPGDHPWTADALDDLGWATAREGDYDAGLARLHEAIAMFERLQSPRVVTSLRRLGVLELQHGDTRGALATLNRAWQLCRDNQIQEQHCVVIRANRARALALTGEGAQALAEAEAAHAALLKLSPEGLESERGQALQARAAALASLQRKDEALAQQDEVIALLAHAFGADHAETKSAVAARERLR